MAIRNNERWECIWGRRAGAKGLKNKRRREEREGQREEGEEEQSEYDTWILLHHNLYPASCISTSHPPPMSTKQTDNNDEHAFTF
jgi:hypothetical protein